MESELTCFQEIVLELEILQYNTRTKKKTKTQNDVNKIVEKKNKKSVRTHMLATPPTPTKKEKKGGVGEGGENF